jgi:hypothetical protein
MLILSSTSDAVAEHKVRAFFREMSTQSAIVYRLIAKRV